MSMRPEVCRGAADETAPGVGQGGQGQAGDADFVAECFGGDCGGCEGYDATAFVLPCLHDGLHAGGLAGSCGSDTDGQQCPGLQEVLGQGALAGVEVASGFGAHRLVHLVDRGGASGEDGGFAGGRYQHRFGVEDALGAVFVAAWWDRTKSPLRRRRRLGIVGSSTRGVVIDNSTTRLVSRSTASGRCRGRGTSHRRGGPGLRRRCVAVASASAWTQAW